MEDFSFQGILDWISGSIASGFAGAVEEIVFGWAQAILDAIFGPSIEA